MKPWSNTHTIAVLWMLVGVMLVLVVAAKVTVYQSQSDWSQVQTPPVPASACHATNRGAWCQ